MSSTSEQLKMIEVRGPVVRALLVAVAVLALLFSWYAVRWYLGGTFAEYAPYLEEEQQLDAALAAVRLAPDDPWTHAVLGALRKKTFVPEDMADSVRRYEEAVRLSPNDYRLWLELGRAREAAGDQAAGEKAMRRAAELAPAYANPHWHLGNLLLREGRADEAFAELRRAADADAQMRPGLFNLAWAVYGEDVETVKRVAGDSAGARSELILNLAGRGRVEDALRIWVALGPAEKKEAQAAGGALADALLKLKRHGPALAVLNDLRGGGAAAVAQFHNPGFEENIEAGVFDWKIKSVPQAQVAIDGGRGHADSRRSLRLLFKAPDALSFDNVSQMVVVEPGAQYRFECYARAEGLKSAATPAVQVLDASDGTTVLGVSQPLPSGTYEWQPVTVDFKAPPKTDAVIVRIVRGSCGADPVCPIFGTVWYDDFKLQTAGGGAPARGGSRE